VISERANAGIEIWEKLPKENGMKQKYSLHKDADNKKLVIKEYAELDKEILSLLCEETYEDDVVKACIDKGTEALIQALRTRNMYPPRTFAQKIADAVVMLYNADGEKSKDIFFDDKEFFEIDEAVKDSEVRLERDAEDLADLLEDDIDDVYDDKKIIKNLKSSLKVADDESVDPEEEP
jgi:hypothetical protein